MKIRLHKRVSWHKKRKNKLLWKEWRCRSHSSHSPVESVLRLRLMFSCIQRIQANASAKSENEQWRNYEVKVKRDEEVIKWPNAAILCDFMNPALSVHVDWEWTVWQWHLWELEFTLNQRVTPTCVRTELPLSSVLMWWAPLRCYALMPPGGSCLTCQRGELWITEPGWGFSKPIKR